MHTQQAEGGNSPEPQLAPQHTKGQMGICVGVLYVKQHTWHWSADEIHTVQFVDRTGVIFSDFDPI